MAEAMTRDETVDALRREVRTLEELLASLGRETVQSMLDAARSRIDTFRVRLALGEMEGRDEAIAAIDAAEHAWARAQRQFERDAEARRDVRAAVDEGVRAAREDLRAAIELAQERVDAR